MYIPITVISNFRNCSLFCTFWLFRNFYSGDAYHANHGKYSLNHQFRRSAHSVYTIDSDFKLFEIAVCFAHFDFFEISTLVMRIMLTMENIVYIIISDIAHTVYIRFIVISKFLKLHFVLHMLLLRNFYSGDAHHANHGKYSLYHYYRHCAHSVYKIYTVFKLFEIAVCSAHFDFFEISTPVMRIMLTMANIV